MEIKLLFVVILIPSVTEAAVEGVDVLPAVVGVRAGSGVSVGVGVVAELTRALGFNFSKSFTATFLL